MDMNTEETSEETDSIIRKLRDNVKVYINQTKEEKRELKERTEKLTTLLAQTVKELSNVCDEYRDLLDNQNEILESVHKTLSNYVVVRDVVDTGRDTGAVITPTQVEGSESPATSRCFISTVESSALQPQNEGMQIQKTLHVQRVIYSERRKKRNQMALSSSGSTSPYLKDRDIEIDEQATPPITKEDIQAQIIDEYQNNGNRKQFEYPYQLSSGPNNELIITDRDQHQLIVFDEKLESSCAYGKMGFGEGTFFFPAGLAVDTVQSCLFVADRNNIIQKFKISYPKAGKFPCLFEYIEKYGSKGSDNGQLSCPCGLAFSSKGYGLFVCDLQNHRIQVFGNEEVTAFGKYGDHAGEFNQPYSIAINSNEDKLFVSDHNNSRVQVFSLQGDFIQIIVDATNAPNWPQLQFPRGIYCTPDHRLLVSSTHTNCILEFEEDGTYKSTMEGTDQPAGVILHHTGDLIVTCTNIKAIIVLKLPG